MAKIGDLVHVRPARRLGKTVYGTLVDIRVETDLFSEKYAIMETNTYVRVLSAGRVMTFEPGEDIIEVIDENR